MALEISMLDRRRFLASLVGLFGGVRSTSAQPTPKASRLGVLLHGLSPSSPPTPEQLARSPLRQGLRARGWIVGENLEIHVVFSEGQADRLEELATELVRRKVDVIWCNGPPPAVAAARAVKTVPIVFWGVGLPVELGLVASLSRPGGNVTGLAYTPGAEIIAKLLELLKTIAPATRRVAAMFEASAIQTVGGKAFLPLATVDPAARKLGVEIKRFPIEDRARVDGLLAAVREWNPDGMLVVGDPATILERQRIVDFENRQRMPGVFGMREFVAVGGLLSYGPNTFDTIRHSASYIDQILRGAKPADLPVEQPSKFELIVNLKTAREIGIRVPQSILLRADEVIE
jgi:putative ABC transport system substrate-binding protein